MAVQGLSGLDAAFLAAETPANPLHVMAAMVLDPSTVPDGYSFERFRDDMGARLGLVPRLHRRLNEVPFAPHGAVWVEDAGLDLGYHIRPATLPAPAGQRELAAFVAGLAERSLDRARPLWQLHVIEGLEHGHIAVVAKLHHALMDGIAGMELMAALFSVAPDAPPFEAVPVSPEASPGMLTLTRVTLAGWLLQQPAAAARAVAESTLATMRVGRWLLLGAPRRVPLPFRAPRMGLGRVPTAHRVMACTSVALADVREISSRFGVTVNDVVLASLGGALRQVLVRRNELPEASLVAAVPVSVHDGDGFGLANALSLMFVSLGTQFDDPVARLDVVHQAAEQAKHLQGAIGPDAILAWLDAVWSPVVKGVARLYGGLQLAERLPPACNLLVSNIAGPPMPLYLGGARLVALYPFGPIYDGMALNITVLSCEGSLDFGLVACPESRLDVWDLAAAISDALAELGKATTPQRDSGIDEG